MKTKTFWIEFVEPNGESGGSESPESSAFLAARRFLAEYDSKGLPAAVVMQSLSRGRASGTILERGPLQVSFNRLGKSDATVQREVARLKAEQARVVSVARSLIDPIDPNEWKAGIRRLNVRAKTAAIAKKTTKQAATKATAKTAAKTSAPAPVQKRVGTKFEDWLRDNGYRRTRSGWISPDGKKFFPL